MKLKLVIVEWRDTSYCDTTNIDDIDDEFLNAAISMIHAGFLIKENTEYIAIGSIFIPLLMSGNFKKCDARRDLLHDQLREVFTIQKKNVIQIIHVRDVDVKQILFEGALKELKERDRK